MKREIFFSILCLLTISTLPIFAQNSIALINVTTDDSLYQEGDTIVISGNVTTRIANEPITVQIFHKGTLLSVAQLQVAEDGSYTHTAIAEGPLWNKAGEYTLRVFYGGETAETVFDFELDSAIPITNDIFEVDAGTSGTFDVKYTIKSGNLTNIAIDPENYTLDIIIESGDEGALTLELPRDSIDANEDGKDIEFIVLIDGAQVDYKEIVDSVSRTLTIEFIDGDSKIEIIGTTIVPEFGTIAALVLAVAIISIIIFTNNRMRIQI